MIQRLFWSSSGHHGRNLFSSEQTDQRHSPTGRGKDACRERSADFNSTDHYQTGRETIPQSHGRWTCHERRNDPYDTLISFTMFFVPLVAAFLLVQVSLCLRSEPLPVARVVSILRGCQVAIAAIIVELLSAWLAVAAGANESQWTPSFTGLEVGLLLVTTVMVSIATVRLARAPRLSRHAGQQDEAEPDWIGDAVAVAKRESRWLGSLRRRAIPVLRGARLPTLIVESIARFHTRLAP
jgi:hypothetical protein